MIAALVKRTRATSAARLTVATAAATPLVLLGPQTDEEGIFFPYQGKRREPYIAGFYGHVRTGVNVAVGQYTTITYPRQTPFFETRVDIIADTYRSELRGAHSLKFNTARALVFGDISDKALILGAGKQKVGYLSASAGWYKKKNMVSSCPVLCGKCRDVRYSVVVAPGNRRVHLIIEPFCTTCFYAAHGLCPCTLNFSKIVMNLRIETVHAYAGPG
jgi:hypothetical protein